MAVNFSLSKLPWYGQIAAFAAIGLVATGAFWNWYAQGARAANDAQRMELVALQTQIAQGRAAEARLPEFRRELRGLEAQMVQLRAVLPDERDVADLLRRVQGMATQSSLTILGFTPRPVARKSLYVEWPIGLKLEGTYHDLGNFLERISKFPRIINVSDLKVRALDKSTNGATMTAEATATTFVLIEGADASAAAAGAASVAANAKTAE